MPNPPDNQLRFDTIMFRDKHLSRNMWADVRMDNVGYWVAAVGYYGPEGHLVRLPSNRIAGYWQEAVKAAKRCNHAG